MDWQKLKLISFFFVFLFCFQFQISERSVRLNLILSGRIQHLLDMTSEWLRRARRSGPGLDLNEEEQIRNAYVLRILFKINNFGDCHSP